MLHNSILFTPRLLAYLFPAIFTIFIGASLSTSFEHTECKDFVGLFDHSGTCRHLFVASTRYPHISRVAVWNTASSEISEIKINLCLGESKGKVSCSGTCILFQWVTNSIWRAWIELFQFCDCTPWCSYKLFATPDTYCINYDMSNIIVSVV